MQISYPERNEKLQPLMPSITDQLFAWDWGIEGQFLSHLNFQDVKEVKKNGTFHSFHIWL